MSKNFAIPYFNELITETNYPKLHSFLSCDLFDGGKPLFNQWLEGEELDDFFNSWLKSYFSRNDSLKIMSDDEVLLFKDDYKVITLKTSDVMHEAISRKTHNSEKSGAFESTSVNTLIGMIGNGALEYQKYFFSPTSYNTYEENTELNFVEKGQLTDRESLEMSSFGDVFDYNVKSDKCEKFFSIKVTYIKERIPLRWRFDADSMRSVRAVATDSESHRYIFAMNIFEKFNYTEGIEVIINIFQSSPDHFVRWEAAKTILKLDTSLGIDLLKTAASNDSHPHVRTAAKKTLKNLKKLEVV